MRLRNVEVDYVDTYVRTRCDPRVMAELGGPLPREGMEAKVRAEAREAAADVCWIQMILPDDAGRDVVAGSIVLWPHDERGTLLSEIGWMLLPEFQGRGLAKQAARMLLERARPVERYLPLPRLRARRPAGRDVRRPDPAVQPLGDRSGDRLHAVAPGIAGHRVGGRAARSVRRTCQPSPIGQA